MRLLFYVTLLAFMLGLGAPAFAGIFMSKGLIMKPDLMAEQLEPIPLPAPEPIKLAAPNTIIQNVEQAAGQILDKPVLPAAALISTPESNVVLATRVNGEPTTARPVIIPALPSMPRYNDNNYIVDFEEYKVLNQGIGNFGPNGMYGSPVPEPGSLLALSGGVIGLIFQANRAGKRSR